MSAAVRMGLIGAGRIAQSYLDVFDVLDDVTLVAVVDPVEDARNRVATRTGAAPFADHESLLQNCDVDAVLVCTPPSTHTEVGRDFIEAGVAVLCEKPLAIYPERARRLIALADSRNVLVTMASKFRYANDVQEAKRILESGTIGETILFENIFASRVPMQGRWNADPAVSGGGVLIDNGTHSVDIARFILGPIVEVSAVEGKRVQGLAVEDTAEMFLRSADGAMGTIDLSWSIDKAVDSYIGIYGAEGTIQVGWRASRYRRANDGEWVDFGTGYDKVAAMSAQVRNFCRAVSGHEQLLITADDAIASVDVVAAAYRSLGRNHWVAVREPVVRSIAGASRDQNVA
jgi:predicted dehydrogenase